MATQTTSANIGTQWGIKWYHIGFALALGFGMSLFPPAGAITYLGWAAGTLGAILAGFLIAGVTFLGIRLLDDWRPSQVEHGQTPDSRVKYAIFLVIALQLFVVGTAISVDVSLVSLIAISALLNPVIAVVVGVDMLRLRGRTVAWESTEFGFPLLTLILGSLGGLGYWYYRGRKRSSSTAQ